MRTMLRYFSTALAIATLAGSATAQNKKHEIDPQAASQNALGLLKEISWTNTPVMLTKQAEAQGKLIFYMHMLGSIAGNT